MSKYPQHDKVSRNEDEINHLNAFITWLREHGYEIQDDIGFPVDMDDGDQVDAIIYESLGMNYDEYLRERRAMREEA